MKKMMLLGWIIILVFSFSKAQAGSYLFTPSQNDLFDLDHSYAYSWKINWSLPAGETIVGASLFFNDIYNWAQENNDILYLQLMDTSPIGGTNVATRIWQYIDNQASGDYFSNFGIQLATYTDPDDQNSNPSHSAADWTYNFTNTTPGFQLTTLKNYAADGTFYLGFDPDCHYYNNGINFTIITERQSVPEPSTFLFLGSGLLLGMGLMRKQIWKKG
jgi:hypothetical protein